MTQRLAVPHESPKEESLSGIQRRFQQSNPSRSSFFAVPVLHYWAASIFVASVIVRVLWEVSAATDLPIYQVEAANFWRIPVCQSTQKKTNAPPISASTCQDGTFKWFWPLQTALAIHRQCPRLFHLGCIIHPAGNPPTPIATGAGASLHQWCCDCRTADYRFLADVRLTLVRHVCAWLGL